MFPTQRGFGPPPSRPDAQRVRPAGSGLSAAPAAAGTAIGSAGGRPLRPPVRPWSSVHWLRRPDPGDHGSWINALRGLAPIGRAPPSHGAALTGLPVDAQELWAVESRRAQSRCARVGLSCTIPASGPPGTGDERHGEGSRKTTADRVKASQPAGGSTCGRTSTPQSQTASAEGGARPDAWV